MFPVPSVAPVFIGCLNKECMMTVQIYDPTIEVKGRHIDFVPRPKSLAGLRVGLVDNSKFNSDQLLERIAKLLECPTIARIGRC